MSSTRELTGTYGSYDPAGEMGRPDDELARLLRQVNLTWEREIEILSRQGLTDGANIAEWGCGPGYFGSRLLQSFPGCSVHGIELNPEFCRHAEANWRIFPDRATVTHGSVLSLPGELSNRFSFVLARYLFQHLSEPVKAASAMLEALRPGGVAAIIDIDEALWGCVVPQNEIFEHLYRRAGAVQASLGGDRMVGRKLLRIMSEAGYVAPSLHVFTVHSDEVGLAAFDFHLNPKRLLPAVQKGVLTIAEYCQALMAYHEFLANPKAYAIILGFVCVGRKEVCPIGYPFSP